MSEIVRTGAGTASNFDRTLAAKRALRNAREARGYSRAQLARLLGHEDDRLVRAWEDEEAANHVPVAALMHPELPPDMFEFIVEKVREARGDAGPLGADSPQEALLALQRSAGQYVTWTGTVGLAAVGAKTAPQGLQIVETLLKNAGIAARFLRRAVTGAHAHARGGAR